MPARRKEEFGIMSQATADVSEVKGKKEEALPLPGFLMKIYYIFPIVLYLPDMLFNFFVYSDGSGLDLNNLSSPISLFYALLWGFLSIGIVGMAWLCSVLAPWHWLRGNKFQSVMCWFGVIVATSITTWNSLAFRSQKYHAFATDSWLGTASQNGGFSLTMILISVSPPFWGLFWAIVQPAIGKRSAAEAEEDHQQKLIRLQQEAEYKRLRAEANAGIRAAQLKGFAATVKAAREQTGIGQGEATVTEEAQVSGPISSEMPVLSERVVPLPRRLSERRANWGDELSESGEHELLRGAAASMSYSVAAEPRDDVFEAPSGEFAARPYQGMLLDGRTPGGTPSGENETVLNTSRPGIPRASTLLRNYADGEHVMRTIDADVERMRGQGMKVTIKSFAEFRGIELSLSKQLLAKWREWKQAQQPAERAAIAE